MSCRNDMHPIEQTASDSVDYMKLRLDKFKLQILGNMSVVLGKIFAIFIVVLLLFGAIIFFSATLVFWMVQLFGSFIIATLIVAGLYLLAAILVYSLRESIFVNPTVGMLSKEFFKKDKDYD